MDPCRHRQGVRRLIQRVSSAFATEGKGAGNRPFSRPARRSCGGLWRPVPAPPCTRPLGRSVLCKPGEREAARSRTSASPRSRGSRKTGRDPWLDPGQVPAGGWGAVMPCGSGLAVSAIRPARAGEPIDRRNRASVPPAALEREVPAGQEKGPQLRKAAGPECRDRARSATCRPRQPATLPLHRDRSSRARRRG